MKKKLKILNVYKDLVEVRTETTNLRIGSIVIKITPFVDKCKKYLYQIAKCKKEEVDATVKEFKKYFEELGKKLGDLRYDLFNSKIDLAKSVKIINLDKTPDQIREIKKYAGLTDEEAKEEFLEDKAEEIKNHLRKSGVQKNEKDGSGLKDLEKEIQSNVDKKLDTLIEAIRNESKEREEIVINNLKDIEKAIDNMVSAGKYSEEFYKELEIAKKDSIFDYVVQSIPITYKDSSKYEKKKENCPNCQNLSISQNNDLTPKVDSTRQHESRGMLGFQNGAPDRKL